MSTVSSAAFRPMMKSGPRGIATYAAAKSGIIGFSRGIALELGPYNITVNCIAPGLTGRSGTYLVMGGKRPSLEDRQKEATAEGQVLPLGVVDPDDISGALLYLVGPHGSRVTGTIMHVNSGAYFPA
jgi:3-oxoacyl-[acyl-carrier protein] reductase